MQIKRKEITLNNKQNISPRYENKSGRNEIQLRNKK